MRVTAEKGRANPLLRTSPRLCYPLDTMSTAPMTAAAKLAQLHERAKDTPAARIAYEAAQQAEHEAGRAVLKARSDEGHAKATAAHERAKAHTRACHLRLFGPMPRLVPPMQEDGDE